MLRLNAYARPRKLLTPLKLNVWPKKLKMLGLPRKPKPHDKLR